MNHEPYGLHVLIRGRWVHVATINRFRWARLVRNTLDRLGLVVAYGPPRPVRYD